MQELQSIWQMVSAVAEGLLRQVPEGTLTATTSAVQKVLGSVNQLAAFKQRQKLSRPGFWEKAVQQQLLPCMMALASAVDVEDDRRCGWAVQLQTEQALATRVCANPACLVLRGCSEARMRSKKCPGCEVVRYCSRQCQLEDYRRHAAVCQHLKQA